MINQIILGDCFEVLSKMDKNSVDLILTDPPYNISKNSKSPWKLIWEIKEGRLTQRRFKINLGLYDFILYNNASIIIAATTTKFFDNNYGTTFNIYIPLHI